MAEHRRYDSEQFDGHNNVFVRLVLGLIGTDDSIVIHRHDQPQAVVVSYEHYMELLDQTHSAGSDPEVDRG